MSFGEWLKKTREEKRLSGPELEKRSGVSRQYISNLETGKPIQPSLEYVDKLAIGLGADVNEARAAAGYAAKTSTPTPPRTMEEFLALAKAWGWVEFMSLASRKPIDEFTEEDFAEFWERMQRHAANEVDWKLRDR